MLTCFRIYRKWPAQILQPFIMFSIFILHLKLRHITTKRVYSYLRLCVEFFICSKSIFVDLISRLPSWASKSMKTLEHIAKVAASTHAATPGTARLKFGFLLKEMLGHFSRKLNATLQPDRLFWLYSGHDLTILNVLNGLGIHDVCSNNMIVSHSVPLLIPFCVLGPFANLLFLFDVWASQEHQRWILRSTVL